MRSKIVHLAVVLSVVTTLVLVSCAPAATPTLTPSPTATPTLTPTPTLQPTPTAKAEEPQYGGTLSIGLGQDVIGFDPSYIVPWSTFTLMLTNDELLTGDWTKGPAGTGETGWSIHYYPVNPSWETASLAERWELTDPQTYTFYLRKGVRFTINPSSEASRLVNGREVTAQDVVFSWDYVMGRKGYYYDLTFGRPSERPEVTAPDKYTVVMKFPPDRASVIEHFADKVYVIPREVIGKYNDLRDWKTSVGSGPFILVDYVPQSSLTFVRNPDYWRSDPFHPDKRLPYIDGVKMLILTDLSTRLAALRTGKIDQLSALAFEDATGLMQSNPELKWNRTLRPTTEAIYMRVDTKPFDDKNVRRALSMAVDLESIKNYYYKGNAEVLVFEVAPLPDFAEMYTPIDKLPQSTRELFEYNPDKAKQLLANAGYPNGFKTEVVCYQDQADLLSVVADYWSKVGVQLDLNMKEYTVWNSVRASNAHKQMIMKPGTWAAYGPPGFRLTEVRWPSTENQNMVNDPRINEAYGQMLAEYLNPAKRFQIMKETNVYILDQAWFVQLPTPYVYTMWQPRVKDYHGEYSIGFWNLYAWPQYIWIDQKLK